MVDTTTKDLGEGQLKDKSHRCPFCQGHLDVIVDYRIEAEPGKGVTAFKISAMIQEAQDHL